MLLWCAEIPECSGVNATTNKLAYAACPKSNGYYNYCFADGPKGGCSIAADNHGEIITPACQDTTTIPAGLTNGFCSIHVGSGDEHSNVYRCYIAVQLLARYMGYFEQAVAYRTVHVSGPVTGTASQCL